jgi:hypothetical protein
VKKRNSEQSNGNYNFSLARTVEFHRYRSTKDKMNRLLIALIEIIFVSSVMAQTNAPSIEQRIKAVYLPHIEFHEAKTLDILSFLAESCIAGDPDECGLSMTLNNKPDDIENLGYKVEDDSEIIPQTMTLEYTRITLFDAIVQITQSLGLTYKFEGKQLVFFTKDGKRISKKWNVEQSPGAYGVKRRRSGLPLAKEIIMRRKTEISRYLAIGFLALGLIAGAIIRLVPPTQYDLSTQMYVDAKQPITAQMLIRTHWGLCWAIVGASFAISGICALIEIRK